MLFSIENFENYLMYLKNANQGINGIRIYLGSYADNDMTTAFFAPTSDGVDNTKLNAFNRINDGCCNKYGEGNYVVTKKYGTPISPETAKKECSNFDTKYIASSKLIGKDDNRSMLFSIENVESYIMYLKNANQGINGVRIYLGSYADNDMTTVFFAPTSDGIDNTKLNALNLGDVGLPPKKVYSENN